jgi:acyl carrier protein
VITLSKLLSLLDHIMSLNGRALEFSRDTALLGSVPELDSMAVVSILTALEEQYGFAADDDEIDGSTFASVGTLLDFVTAKLAA